MIRVEIKNSELVHVSGTSKTGKPYSFNKQVAWAHLPGQPYPTRIELTVDSNETGYPIGDYILGPDSFMVDRFGKLTIGRVQLVKQTARTAA